MTSLGEMNRRRLLQLGLGVGVTLGGSALLGGCTSAPNGSHRTTGDSYTKPKRGGQYVRGIVGDGPQFAWNPGAGQGVGDYVRGVAVYDTLAFSGLAGAEPALAQSWEVTADAKLWTLHLRDGVRWHDGTPFTADDVVYTLKSMGSPYHYGNFTVANVDLAGVRKRDDLTVEVPLKTPDAGWIDLTVGSTAALIKDGTKEWTRPVGTGAFVFESGEPGRRATFKRNPDYWMDGAPYPDSLVIVAISDDNAGLNAVSSGQVDAIEINATLARALPQDLVASYTHPPAGAYTGLVMQTQKPPFNDVRVRQAMALAIDREAIDKQLFGGRGTIFNDLVGKGAKWSLPGYSDEGLPQRAYDPDQAKSLLRQAGHSTLDVELAVTPMFGLDQLAQLFKEQAAGAGINVALRELSPEAFYNPQQGYGSRPFSVTAWPVTSLRFFYDQALVSTAPLSEAGFKDPKFDQLYASAKAELDAAKAKQKWADVQRYVYEQVPFIWPVNGGGQAAVYNKKVHNVFSDYTPDKVYPTASIGDSPSGWRDLWVG